MRIILSKTKVALSLLIFTVIFLSLYTYMLARPISYGMDYHNEMVYDGIHLEGRITFHLDGTATITSEDNNTSVEQPWYYLNGRMFFLRGMTEQERADEIEYINQNFEEVAADPYYSANFNAFAYTNDYFEPHIIYACKSLIVFAVSGGVFAIFMIYLTVRSFVLSKKAKCKKTISDLTSV